MSQSSVGSQATDVSIPGALWLTGTVLLALTLLYLVGIEQGVVSIFGGNTVVHEFAHDARHLLGFPCH
ncbi:CbtB-domain containing protein [Mycolicibacterium neoaurum]|uniref:CbtB domain-containing protein n=1 Tax=Mycolicibacterium neoaurum TaxID=1795 RepID=UPI002671F77F|nr:CbtB-domain containing protein [Mycolicibacterium neoaurum]MDO3401615.1 CbtB-domain containing protein [Mycolicibacterium neoaurum]